MRLNRSEWVSLAIAAAFVFAVAVYRTARSADGNVIIVRTQRAASAEDVMASGTLPDLQLEMHTVDINTADANELELLPGIGPALAKRIIEYRERHGVYSSAEDIMDVSGIGQGIFEDIKPYISVSGGG